MSELKQALERKLFQVNERGMDVRMSAKDMLELLWPVIAAAERLREHHRAWISGARADLIYERMEKEFDALTALKRELDGRGDDGG